LEFRRRWVENIELQLESAELVQRSRLDCMGTLLPVFLVAAVPDNFADRVVGDVSVEVLDRL
jgi:hypothetical protein